MRRTPVRHTATMVLRGSTEGCLSELARGSEEVTVIAATVTGPATTADTEGAIAAALVGDAPWQVVDSAAVERHVAAVESTVVVAADSTAVAAHAEVVVATGNLAL